MSTGSPDEVGRPGPSPDLFTTLGPHPSGVHHLDIVEALCRNVFGLPDSGLDRMAAGSIWRPKPQDSKATSRLRSVNSRMEQQYSPSAAAG